MKLPLSFAAAAAILLLIAIACQRETLDASREPTPPENPHPDKMVTSTFQGKVLDENGSPMSGAMVTAGGTTTHTNEYGIFRFDNIITSQQFAYLKVEKPGYFPGSRTVVASEGGFSFMEVKLLPLQSRGNFESASGAKIDILSDASVSFQPNSIRLENGSPYSGSVNVFAAIIDPDASDFASIMPGSLRGVRADNSVAAIISYGTLAITLTGDGGEALQPDPGHPVTITMNIPASLRASAPQEITLWYFDEDDGKWKEEGVATKNGNSYSGLVKHFSYWNYVVPQDFVFVDFELKSDDGDPVSYNIVKITNTHNGWSNIASTDSTGYLRILAPKNVPVEIQVVNDCGEVILSHNAGPFSEDSRIGTLIVPSEEMIVISGNVIDCEANPIAEGYVNVIVDGLYYGGAISEGAFSVYINKCRSSSLRSSVYAVEAGTFASSESVKVRLDSLSVNAGVLTICTKEEVGEEQYIRFKIESTEYELTTPAGELQYDDHTPFKLLITGSKNIMDSASALIFQLESVNDTIIRGPTTHFLVKADGVNYASAQGDVNVTITRFGQVNEFVELRFEGPLQRANDNTIVNFSGDLRVIRKKFE